MLEINYTDKTGTYTVIQDEHHTNNQLPDQSIVNSIKRLCPFCLETKIPINDDDSVCDKCAKMFGERQNLAERINACDF